MAIVLLCFSSTAFSQSNTKEISTMKTADNQRTSWSYTYEVDSVKLATKKQSSSIGTPVKDVNYYNYFINALEIKREYVLNNPTEKAIADEKGWFEQIDSELAKAKLERDKLLEKK